MLFWKQVATAVAVVGLPGVTRAGPVGEVQVRNVNLPTVDLGYAIQQATAFNESGNYFNFSNIRYGQSPTGELRWRVPLPPKEDRSVVQTGEVGRICPQANPAWLLTAAQYIPQYLQGKKNFTESDFNTSSAAGSAPPQDPRVTEDCLFLDVQVPRSIFENRDKISGAYKGAPVLVWIHGGGYTASHKSSQFNPAGLLAKSRNNDNSGVVFVSINYRLGAFGWLSGPTFQEDGVANVGLYDQRLALEWVQSEISKFGGDPNRVTVFGESAGGGSIMHQVTAFGGAKPAPFQQAVIQSPGFKPTVSALDQEKTLGAFLYLLNVSSIEEARKLPSDTLQGANIIQTGLAAYGKFTWGPVVDGIIAPQLPGQLLAKGQFVKELKVMVGHNTNEGLLFTSPFAQDEAAYQNQVLGLQSSLAAYPEVIDYISTKLYPNDAYPDQIARAAATVADSGFVCNTYYLDKAFGNQTYAYLFAVPPGLHGDDIEYTFNNDDALLAPQIADALQEYITHFAEFGTPSEKGVPYFPLYGNNATVQVLNVTGITQARDPAANERCNWWQKALYY